MSLPPSRWPVQREAERACVHPAACAEGSRRSAGVVLMRFPPQVSFLAFILDLQDIPHVPGTRAARTPVGNPGVCVQG